MDWSPAARAVWGKLDPRGDGWMPLVIHLEDSAAVAGYLWDEFLPDAVRRYICDGLEIPDAEGRILVSWLAGVHDVAKATPAFAAKAEPVMRAVLGPMRDHGLDARQSPEDRHVPHATAGQVILDEWLARRFPDSTKRARLTFTCIVGGHHGTTPSNSTVTQAALHPAQLGDGSWRAVRDEILDAMASATGASDHLAQWLQRRIPAPTQVLLTGIVIMADWIASNTDYFPYSVGECTLARLDWATSRLRLPPPWEPDIPSGNTTELLTSRFPALRGHGARPLQEALTAAARAVRRPSLFILEGPMGVGKTEAALLAAEILADRFGLGGVFVGLPTMATANPMFDRVSEWSKAALGEQVGSIALVHGKAALNDHYGDLIRESWHGAVYDDGGEPSDVERAGVVVNEWMRGRKRSGLADFVVGTIDQSLFVALKAKHVVLRHLGLAGKVVIIDEVHAADDYMSEYLKCLLAWLGAYGTPVILMSATLPPGQRDELAAAYADGRTAGTAQLPGTSRSDDYPRVTIVDDTVQEITVGGDGRSLDVAVSRLSDDLPELVDLLKRTLAEGGCAAVICNTVTRAQEAYAALRDVFGSQVTLAHSRFIAPDRARREAELVGQLGPAAPDRPERLVVVGTQVLEQSLDVDFDLMVTDLAPADLLLQRAGRLHRHDRPSRPRPVSTPSLCIRGVEDWSATPPTAVSGSRAVYGSQRLLRAAAVLHGVESIHLPTDIPTLVRLAYEPSSVAPSGWETAWQAGEDREFIDRQGAIRRAQTYLMRPPWQKENLAGLVDVDGGDPDKREEQGKSQVRDSDEGLEVFALWRGSDDLLRLPSVAPRFAGRVVPEAQQWGTGTDEELAREMAKCTLRLPASLCYERIVDAVIADLERMADYSGWQTSRWIKGQLAVAFNESDECQVAGYTLAYDPEQGLRVTHPKETRR